LVCVLAAAATVDDTLAIDVIVIDIVLVVLA
jgi:hypothetical protein